MVNAVYKPSQFVRRRIWDIINMEQAYVVTTHDHSAGAIIPLPSAMPQVNEHVSVFQR